MSYLFVGGEDSDFTPINPVSPNGPYVDTGILPIHYRPQFARYGMCVLPSSGKNGSQFQAQNVFSQASFWFSARVWCGPSGFNSPNDILQLLDTSNLPRIALRNTQPPATGPFQVCTVNTAGIYVPIGGNFISSFQAGPSGPDKLDVFINYAISGTITVYINNVQVYTYLGDVTTNSVAALTGFALGSHTYGQGNQSYMTIWSEIIVSTTDTRNLSLATLYPIVAGNTASWSGSVAAMSAVPSQPQNPMTTGTATAVQEFVTATPIPVMGYLVDAVVVAAQANCGTTGPQHAQLMLRTGATDYNSGTLNLGNNYTYISNIWPTNPNTSLAWTVADITTSVCKWNTTNASSVTVFSADALQVTINWSTNPVEIVPASQPHTSGQWYLEITASSSVGSTGLGVCNYNSAIGNAIGNDINSMRYAPSGGVVTNNVTITTLATYTTGNVIGLAIDLSNKTIWFRIGAGNWNNNVANNPTTNTGGINIASICNGPASAVMPCIGTFGSGISVWTANFGATSFANAAPSGFSAWNTTTVSNALNIGIEAIA